MRMRGRAHAASGAEEGRAERLADAGRAPRRRSARGDRDRSEAGAAADGARRAGTREGRAAARRIPRWPFVVTGTLLAFLLIVVGLISWDRWYRYDDAADFQGAWYAQGKSALITIDGERIHLTSDVAYAYTLDTGAKTISFTFGNMAGEGRYRFSDDRSELVIMEGDGFTWSSTLFDDLGWKLDDVLRSIQGQGAASVAAGDGVTVLDRQPVGSDSAPAGTAAAADAVLAQGQAGANGAASGDDAASADGDGAAGADAAGGGAAGSSS